LYFFLTATYGDQESLPSEEIAVTNTAGEQAYRICLNTGITNHPGLLGSLGTDA
jgi:hypothetical protein